jgi:hypothetical protein
VLFTRKTHAHAFVRAPWQKDRLDSVEIPELIERMQLADLSEEVWDGLQVRGGSAVLQVQARVEVEVQSRVLCVWHSNVTCCDVCTACR